MRHEIEYSAVRDPKQCPAHPGTVIGDILLDFPKLTKTELADRLGISRNQLHAILAERKPVSPEVAVRIAKVLGGTATGWLRIQTAFDAWHAERTVDVSKQYRLETAAA